MTITNILDMVVCLRVGPITVLHSYLVYSKL